jgi:hypothetical protein
LIFLCHRFYELQRFIDFVCPDTVHCGLPGQGGRLLAYTDWSSLTRDASQAAASGYIAEEMKSIDLRLELEVKKAVPEQEHESAGDLEFKSSQKTIKF